MRLLTIQCPGAEKDLVLADLCEAGTLGVSEQELGGGRWRLEACFDDGADGLDRLLSHYAAEVSRPEAVDWVAVSRAQWNPFPVGTRFYLVPAWRDDPAPQGRLRLPMPPGTASGTGLHPATQLALQGLERVLRPGDTMLDLGTGSGILAAAARLLGAGCVVACDIDPDAVAAAKEYLQGSALLFAGSCRSLRNAPVHVVAANLNAQALAVVMPDLARVLAPGGRAVLSGFPEDLAPRIEQQTRPAGLTPRDVLVDGGYAALLTEKASDG